MSRKSPATSRVKEIHAPAAFEQFLADLSACVVNASGERINAEIQNGLQQLVEFFGVERGSFIRLASDASVIIVASYTVPGIVLPPLRGQFRGGFGWYASELMQRRVVRISTLNDLPREAIAERAFARAIALKSHLGIPVSLGGIPLCGLGVTTVGRERQFSDEWIRRLRLIGEVFTNALARRDAEQRVKLMIAELSHVTRVSTMGHLAASIAHEINQPLTAIITNASAALRQLAKPEPEWEEIRGALSDIAADGKRAAEVVTRSHGQLKQREQSFEALSINDVIRDVASLVHSEAVIRRVGLRLELNDSLPLVSGDPVQLQQVVLNLVLNALDATAHVPEGSRHITLASDQAKSQVRVRVSDTGIGLTPEIAARMFDPFFTTKAKGLGMGLTINLAIIEAHGGKLRAARSSRRGACLAFSLPSHKAAPE